MRSKSLSLVLCALALTACGGSSAPPAEPSPAAAPEAVAPAPEAPPTAPEAQPASPEATDDGGQVSGKRSARAELAPASGSKISGQLTFLEEDGKRVKVVGTITGLPAKTKHGFHVHEKGDCSAPDGKSAGAHFAGEHKDHGQVGKGTHHAGDMDNLESDEQGTVKVDRILEGVTLGDGSATDIIGKAVILHADPDDYKTQPSGNAGARIGCGVITAI